GLRRPRICLSTGRCEPIVLDVTDTGTLQECIRRLDDTEGGLDWVIANAGVGGHTNARAFSWEVCLRIINTNVLGAAATLTAALPGMLRRNRGHLVAVASLSAFRGLPKDAAYGGSKAFLRSFMQSLEVDLRSSNVRTTCVYPGFVGTEMTAPNQFRMPFLTDAATAADRIGRAIEAGKAELRFPWQAAAGVSVMRLLPRTVYQRLADRASLTRTDVEVE
ncbi:SDR family NAD(P)-dependent oxidoreductase, partial [Myxococcota bacterium]